MQGEVGNVPPDVGEDPRPANVAFDNHGKSGSISDHKQLNPSASTLTMSFGPVLWAVFAVVVVVAAKLSDRRRKRPREEKTMPSLDDVRAKRLKKWTTAPAENKHAQTSIDDTHAKSMTRGGDNSSLGDNSSPTEPPEARGGHGDVIEACKEISEKALSNDRTREFVLRLRVLPTGRNGDGSGSGGSSSGEGGQAAPITLPAGSRPPSAPSVTSATHTQLNASTYSTTNLRHESEQRIEKRSKETSAKPNAQGQPLSPFATGDSGRRESLAKSELESTAISGIAALVPRLHDGSATGDNMITALSRSPAAAEPRPERRPEPSPAPEPEPRPPGSEQKKPLPASLPGWMQLSELLVVLEAGPRAAYEALCRVAGPNLSSIESKVNPQYAVADVCRRWWDAAIGAGRTEFAQVAADAFRLHLDSVEEDLFTTADQARATIILAFLRTSPHPTMVRRVFRQSPKAGLAAVHLVMQPLRVTTDGLSNQAIAAAAARKAQRLESWQPLSGLESTVELLESSAGATALAVAMGIEAADCEHYGHGAHFEQTSVLGPVLGYFSFVLPLRDHVRAASPNIKLSHTRFPGDSGMQRSSPEAPPVAHHIARLRAQLDRASPLERKGLAVQHDDLWKLANKNRHCLVDVVAQSLTRAMTTKGVMADAKRDVSAWLTKVIYLHETLPELCGQDAPELLGEPNTGSTCASSGFLMSLSALLLRLGSWRFTSTIDEKGFDDINVAYPEDGPIKWTTAVESRDYDSDEDVEDVAVEGGIANGRARSYEQRKSSAGEGVQETKESSEPQGSNPGTILGWATTGATVDGVGPIAAAAAMRTGREHEQEEGALEAGDLAAVAMGASSTAGALRRPARKDMQQQQRNETPGAQKKFTFSTHLFFLTHRALQVINSSLHKRWESMQQKIHDTAAHAGVPLSGNSYNKHNSDIPNVYQEAASAVTIAWLLEGFGSESIAGLACRFADFTAAWIRHQLRRSAAESSPLAPSPLEAFGDRGDAKGSSACFFRILPVLLETTCAAWIDGAHASSRTERFLSHRAAAEAASFCGDLMERVDLHLSPVAHAKLVDVLETLIDTGTQAIDRLKADTGGFQASMYWGARRGYAGAILDDQTLRRSLPRQLMQLYAAIGAVEGLRAEHHLGYFKTGVRIRVGKIILHLWGHPLGEPRAEMVKVMRASLPRAGRITEKSGNSDGNAGNRTPEHLAPDFLKAAFDIITYFFDDAMVRLKDGRIEERSNDGRPLEAGHPHWGKYQADRKQCISGLTNAWELFF